MATAGDVPQRADIRRMIDACVAEFGGLDVMFNNAGFNKPEPFLDITEEVWHQIMNVNALGVLMGCQEAAKTMIAQGSGGKIVNTASIAGRQGFPSFVPYCVSKFGVMAITQGAARALAAHDITVNAFAPGVVATPLWDKLDKDLMDIGDSERPGQAMEEFSAGILQRPRRRARRHRRHGALPGVHRLRLHDRPGRDDRRRHGPRLTMELDVWYDVRNPPQWYRDPADAVCRDARADRLGRHARLRRGVAVGAPLHRGGLPPGLMPMLGADGRTRTSGCASAPRCCSRRCTTRCASPRRRR